MSFACRGGHPLSGIKIIFFRIGETLEYRWTRRRFDNIPVKLCNVAIGKSVVVQPPTTSVPFFWVLHAVVLGIFASLEKTHTFPFALPFDMLKIETRRSGLRAKEGHGPEGTRSRRLIGWFYTFARGALGRVILATCPHVHGNPCSPTHCSIPKFPRGSR